MKNVAAWLVALIVVLFTARYAYQVYRKEIGPALSTWLIVLTGVLLSFATYVAAEDKDIKSGILNTVDLVAALTIASSVMLWGNVSGIRFKPFEKKYLIGAGAIVVFWIISKNAFISNLLVQILLIIGYIPTIQNLITEKRNTESFSAWLAMLAAGVIALYPAIVGGNTLAIIYTSRSTFVVSVILTFMTFYHVRTSQKRR